MLHDYSGRIRKLQILLKKNKLDGIYLSHPTSLLYCTGLELSLGKLLVSPSKAILFVDSRYREYAENNTYLPIKNLDPLSLQKTIAPWKKVGFEGSDMTYNEVLALKKGIAKGAKMISVGYSKELRSIKEESEIECLRLSACLLWKGFLYLQSQLKRGITEEQLDRKFRKFCIDHEATLAFDPIIAFGRNASKPHHKSGSTTLEENTLVLIDIGLHIQSYASDMTRTIFFGNIDSTWKRLYDIVAEAKEAALKLCKAGTIIRELDLASRAIFRREGLQSYFVHSLGHGVGLEVHERPTIHKQGDFADLPLQENMVITIEPGLYFPGKGGIRIEDTLQITKKGYTNFFPNN